MDGVGRGLGSLGMGLGMFLVWRVAPATGRRLEDMRMDSQVLVAFAALVGFFVVLAMVYYFSEEIAACLCCRKPAQTAPSTDGPSEHEARALARQLTLAIRSANPTEALGRLQAGLGALEAREKARRLGNGDKYGVD